MQKFLTLLDASNYIFRAYYAVKRPITDENGNNLNAVYGFCSMLLKVLNDKVSDENSGDFCNEKIIAVFDYSRHSFRNEIYPDYKAHRGETPEDLIPQFNPIRQAVKAFGLPCVEIEGWEADDILATYANDGAKKEDSIVKIISCDKDLMQLVKDGEVFLYDSMKDKIIEEKEVKEKFKVLPSQVVDVQAILGDSVDNIPGVKGVGPVGAGKLINEFGSLENLIENLDKVKNEKLRNLLSENIDNMKISYRLAMLKKDIDLKEYDLSQYSNTCLNRQGMLDFLAFFNFKSLIPRAEKLLDKWEKVCGANSIFCEKIEVEPLDVKVSEGEKNSNKPDDKIEGQLSFF